MITEAEEIWVERDGSREKMEAEAERITPTAAFVAAVLDGAPNISPAREAALVVALTEAAYRSAEEGHIIEISQLAAL